MRTRTALIAEVLGGFLLLAVVYSVSLLAWNSYKINANCARGPNSRSKAERDFDPPVASLKPYRLFFYVSDNQPEPPQTCLVLKRPLGRVWLMPEEFGQLLQRRNTRVQDSDTAVKIAQAYVSITQSFGEEIILSHAADVAEGLDPDRFRRGAVSTFDELVSSIQPPSAIETYEGFEVKIFSWSYIGGMVKEWNIVVGRDGELRATEEDLGKMGKSTSPA